MFTCPRVQVFTGISFQVMALLAAVLGIILVAPLADAGRVYDCMRGCGACVEIFGKELYDGRRCAVTCHLTEVQCTILFSSTQR